MDTMPDAAEDIKAEKERIEGLRQRVETLENMGDTISNMDKSDLQARALLSQEAYDKVYTPAMKALENAPAKVKANASDAILAYSRIVDTMAQNYGEPVEKVAADILINTNKNIDNNQLNQMFFTNKVGIDSINKYYDRVKRGITSKENLTKFGWKGKNGIIYSADVMAHIINGKSYGSKKHFHPLTKEEFIDFEDHSDKLYGATITANNAGLEQGVYHGIPVIVLVKGKLQNYYGIISFPKNQKAHLVTILKETDSGVYSGIINRAYKSKKKDGVLIPISSAGMPVTPYGTINTPSSIQIIQEGLKEINEKLIKENGKGLYKQYVGNNANTDNTKALKERQLALLLKENPMHDDYHTGIRTLKDILTAEEAFSQMIEDKDSTNPDFTWRMMKNALKSGYVTVYSSNPIKPGTFITPSQMMAKDYAGGGKIYKKRVPITEVAWIDDAEGEYAPVGSYFQQQGKYAGAYDPVQNIIHIFDAGNQSTILHESAHMYLTILKRMAQEIPDNRKIQSDLETIQGWAEFSEDHLAEYEGTDLEKEFNSYAEACRKGDKEALDRFEQERFARGFERYIMEGKAPTPELRGVFGRLKRWMLAVYSSAKSLGKEPPEEIKAIFDGMLATQNELDAYAAERQLDRINNLGIDFTKTEKENLEAWTQEIKEKASAQILKEYEDSIKESMTEEFEDALDEMTTNYEREILNSDPIYKVAEVYNSDRWPTQDAKKKWLESQGYTEESLKEALDKAGGTLEERSSAFRAEQKKNFLESVITPENIRQAAEDALNSSEGNSKRVRLESVMLKNRIDKYINQAKAAIVELRAASPEEQAKVVENIKDRMGLNTEEAKANIKEGRKEREAIRNKEEVKRARAKIKELKDQLAKSKAEGKELEAEKAKAQEEIDRLNDKITKGFVNETRANNAKAEADQLRDRLQKTISTLTDARTQLNMPLSEMRKQARAELSKQKVSQAISWKWWDNKAEAEGVRAEEYLKKGEYSAAAEAKKREYTYTVMARTAREIEDEIKKTLRGNPKATTKAYDKDGMEKYGILGIINRIGRTEKPVRMSEQSRYFVQHLAYQLGLTNDPGRLPTVDGKEVPFDWIWLEGELNANYMAGEQSSESAIPLWIRDIFDKQQQTPYGNLSVERFRAIMQALKVVYHIGRRDYDGTALTYEGKQIGFEDAAALLFSEAMKDHNWEDPMVRKYNEKTLKQKTEDTVEKITNELALPEIMLERLGKAWQEILYMPIDRAARKEAEMTEHAVRKMNDCFRILGGRKEWQKIRSERKYLFGAVNLTKEEVLAVALNWGNRDNRNRIIESFGYDETTIEEMLSAYMTEKDWDFVEAVWDHVGSYWEEMNAVRVDLYGVPLGKQPPLPFIINGRKIKGGYYPIVYDPDLSNKTSERAINEIIQQQMAGGSTFTLGTGFTNSRKQNSGRQTVLLSLNVYTNNIKNDLHWIAMRTASVDVYKLISKQIIADAITQRLGKSGYEILKQWASDNWHSDIDKADELKALFAMGRRNYTFSVMAFRATTALLNLCNIGPVMHKLGPVRALHAISRFYFNGRFNEQRRFIFEKSVMMRNRSANMDRDLERGFTLPEQKDTSKAMSMARAGAEKVNHFGYSCIAATDLMLSMPEWLDVYNHAIRENRHKLEGEALETYAVEQADKAVRETFGSGNVKDQPHVIKTRMGEILPFYSYCNLVLNQFIRAGYQLRDGVGIKPLIMATLFWYLVPQLMETGLRILVDISTGRGDDDWKKYLAHSFASGGPQSGVPFMRELLPFIIDRAAGKYTSTPTMVNSGGMWFNEAGNLLKTLTDKDIDAFEVGRAASRFSNRTMIPFSDTITDGFWTAAKLALTDTDASMTELLADLIFDRRVKKDKSKKSG